MKILFLANRTPFPPYRGDKLKIFHLAKRIGRQHEIHLLTFAQNQEDLGYQAELEKIFHKVHQVYLPKWKSAVNCLAALWSPMPVQVLYFRSGVMKEKLAALLEAEQFDAVHVQHLRMSPYLASRQDIPRILDMPDAFSLYWRRRKEAATNPFVAMFNAFEYKRLLNYEKVMKQYNMALVCSAEDKAYLEEVHHLRHLRLLPNGVDLDTFAAGGHDYTHNRTLLFTGNMDYAPNVDAVQYFVKDILPTIRQKHPAVKLVIAGQRPVKKVTDLACDHVEVTGFVKDLAAVYNSASVVVAPLRFGAGTQNKVLEAMAMGVPVVCSHIGFKGLGISSGEGAIMQTEPLAFAASVIQLLDNMDERIAVGTRGVEIMRSRFGWDAISSMLTGYLEDIAKK